MKINFEMSGGFASIPALSRSAIIDTANIDLQVADQLKSLVQQSRFFEQPSQAGTMAKGAADYRIYNIKIEDGLRVHTIRLTDPIADANLAKLISQLRTIAASSKS